MAHCHESVMTVPQQWEQLRVKGEKMGALDGKVAVITGAMAGLA